MLKNSFKKTAGVLMVMVMILTVFTVSPVFALVAAGNMVFDVFDGVCNTGNNLPEEWALFKGPESSVMFQSSMVTICNELTTEQMLI